jgi:DNA-binding XRE family transcriptional regulator
MDEQQVEEAGYPRAGKTKARTKLAALRAARGVSQREMASATGLKFGTYVRLERGDVGNPQIRAARPGASGEGSGLR